MGHVKALTSQVKFKRQIGNLVGIEYLIDFYIITFNNEVIIRSLVGSQVGVRFYVAQLGIYDERGREIVWITAEGARS